MSFLPKFLVACVAVCLGIWALLPGVLQPQSIYGMMVLLGFVLMWAVLSFCQASRHEILLLFKTFLIGEALLLLGIHFMPLSVRFPLEIAALVLTRAINMKMSTKSNSNLYTISFSILISWVFLGLVHFYIDSNYKIPYDTSPKSASQGISLLLFAFFSIFIGFRAISSMDYAVYQRELNRYKLESDTTWFAATFGLVSHNIKTPLANIQGQLEILKLYLIKGDFERKTDVLNRIQKIEDSVYIAKTQLEQTIDTYKRQMSLVTSHELSIPLLFVELQREFPKVNFIDPQPLPLSDKEYFAVHLSLQVALDNALKYGDKERLPTVRNEEYCLYVQDFGKGFNSKILTNQGLNIVHSSGSGIGLYFALRILKTSGWTFSLSNTHEGGLVCIYKGRKVNDAEMAKIW